MYGVGVEINTPMTLFQTHKLIRIEGREDFWMPHGPAFFTQIEADEYHVQHYAGRQYEVLETAPLGMGV